MASHLNELDGDSLLVIYLAGELTNGDKAALERRLANEPALAAELQRLRDAQTFCVDALRASDASAKMPVGEGVAGRRVSRAIQQWHVDRLRATPRAGKKGLRIPWWSYPVAVAASLIIGFLIWSSRQSVEQIDAPNDLAANAPTTTEGDQPDETQQVASAPDIDTWMEISFGGGARGGADGGASGESSASAFADEVGIAPEALDDPATSMFPTHEETLQ